MRDNTTKHTLENVLEVPEVVIGTVNFTIVQQISLASTEYETGVNEFIKSGLTMKDADLVKPKLIAECPVNFECKVLEVKSLGDQGGAGNLVICEVQKIHIREEYLNEAGNLDQQKLDMVARLGSNWYSRSNENSLLRFQSLWLQKVSALIFYRTLSNTVRYLQEMIWECWPMLKFCLSENIIPMKIFIRMLKGYC